MREKSISAKGDESKKTRRDASRVEAKGGCEEGDAGRRVDIGASATRHILCPMTRRS